MRSGLKQGLLRALENVLRRHYASFQWVEFFKEHCLLDSLCIFFLDYERFLAVFLAKKCKQKKYE